VILLDTSVLSRSFRRKRPGAAERAVRAQLEELLESEAAIGIPGIVLQEVLSGVASSKQVESLREQLQASFPILPATESDHIEAARVRNACTAAGVNASTNACLIAACAIDGGHELFALDDDYVAIAKHTELKLYRGAAWHLSAPPLRLSETRA
jgi:hypothetical protein